MSNYTDFTTLTPEELANFVCTKELCDVAVYGWLDYYPSLPGNILFLVIFALLLPPQLYLGIKYHTTGICITLTFALIMEILGYIGRVLMYNNPFTKDWFLLYLIDLTIGPTFIAAGIYLCLSRLVVVFDGDEAKGSGRVARWKPRTYTLFFLVWDLISLILQAIGGAIASLGEDEETVDLGTHIMVAGLSVQVASLLLFIIIVSELAWRWRSKYRQGNLNKKHQSLYQSKKFKSFIYVLALSTLCIFIRSVFRVAELSDGFNGELANNEISFMILDGTMVVIALIALTICHPGMGFGGVWQEANFRFRTKGKKEKGGDGEIIEGVQNGKEEEVRVREV